MQLTLEVDKNLAEALQKEFATPNLKDAFGLLLDFYKKNRLALQENIEIIASEEEDYREIVEARQRREDGEKIYDLDQVIGEFQ
jgi:hypothetical protein